MPLTPEHFPESHDVKSPGLPRVAAVTADRLEIMHLAELVKPVRERFALPPRLSDDTILDSLKIIALHSNVRDRWRAAFKSPLGASLATGGRDLNTALTTLIALLPRPTS